MVAVPDVAETAPMNNDLQLHMVAAHQASLQRAANNARAAKHARAAKNAPRVPAPSRDQTVLLPAAGNDRLITRVLSWRPAINQAPR